MHASRRHVQVPSWWDSLRHQVHQNRDNLLRASPFIIGLVLLVVVQVNWSWALPPPFHTNSLPPRRPTPGILESITLTYGKNLENGLVDLVRLIDERLELGVPLNQEDKQRIMYIYLRGSLNESLSVLGDCLYRWAGIELRTTRPRQTPITWIDVGLGEKDAKIERKELMLAEENDSILVIKYPEDKGNDQVYRLILHLFKEPYAEWSRHSIKFFDDLSTLNPLTPRFSIPTPGER